MDASVARHPIRAPFVDAGGERRLPSSACIVSHPLGGSLAARVRHACQRTFWGIPPEEFHRTGRFRQDLQKAVSTALSEPETAALLEELLVDAAAWLFPGEGVAVQEEPYARVVPPRQPAAVKSFHVDAYIGHPRNQRGLWIPVVDVQGPEGLWLVDDDVVRPLLEERPLSAAAMAAMGERAWMVPMRAGEILVLSAVTGHGGHPHELDRTRVSFDVRLAPAHEAPRGRLGWRSRPLPG